MFVYISIQSFMLFLLVIHVMCFSLVFRKDIDIGFVVLGDLQKKCKYVILHKQQITESPQPLRSIQLRLIYATMEMENLTEYIAMDVDFIRMNLYKGPLVDTIFGHFQTNISEALGLADIEAVSLPFQLQLDEVEGLRTQDLPITQFARKLEDNSERFFIQYHFHHSCNIQVTNQCNFNILY